jgi:predicted MFS family arabinose efflux permease
MVSAAIGPALGGVLVGLIGWQSIFVVNLPLALIGIGLALTWLPRDRPQEQAHDPLWRALDLSGIVVFAATLAVLLFFLMGLNNPDWLLFGGFLVLAGATSIVELRASAPFLDLRMVWHNQPLLRTYLRLVLVNIVIYGVLYGYTQWLEDARGMSSEATGLLLLPMSAIAAVASALGARGRRVRGPLLIGTVVLLAGSVVLLGVNSSTGILLLVGIALLFGIPNGLNMVANQAALYEQAPADQIGTAAGLSRTAQYLGAIFSSGLISLFYGRTASTSGLRELTWTFLVLGALLLAITIADRALRARH